MLLNDNHHRDHSGVRTRDRLAKGLFRWSCLLAGKEDQHTLDVLDAIFHFCSRAQLKKKTRKALA